jgi:hypothetical protein
MALDFIQNAQDPKGGGWRYAPQQPGDTSATGWQVSALLAGKRAGLAVRNDVLVRVQGFLDSVQVDGGSGYGYMKPSRLPANSAVGLFCRTQIGGFGWTPRKPAVAQGMDYLVGIGPTDDPYFDFYATRALAQAEPNQRRQWADAMQKLVVSCQSREGHENGSWWDGFNRGHASEVGGRSLCTAFAVLILEACDIQ